MDAVIKFQETQLNSAIARLQALRTKSSPAKNGSSRLIVNGIGDTADAVNGTWAALRQIDGTLDELISVTVDALKAAGVLFPEADAAAAKGFEAISATLTGGPR